MKKIIFNALLTGSVLAGTAGFATAQTAGDVSGASGRMSPPAGGGAGSRQEASAGSHSVTTPGAKVSRDFYDKKGRLLFTIDYYGEKGLPATVRSLVRSVYYDYTIRTVEEVKFAAGHVYLVDMQDDTTIKTVRVADGEMEVVRDLVRGDRADR
jgi:hypothetical protein